MAEGAQALLNAWCKDIADARVNGVKPAATRATSSVGTVINTYDTAKWGQGKPFNNECPIIDNERAVTGCVATASAIICYYHRWPNNGVGSTGSYSYTKEGQSISIPNNDLGRSYDYDNMIPSYKGSYTQEQGAAVAALMFDLGTATHMGYGADSSGANITRMAKAMVNNFGYSKQLLYLVRESYPDDIWWQMLRDNLKTYGPTYYRGRTTSDIGHAFLLDGYTDKDYFRVNYGHNGSSDGFYYLPSISYWDQQRAMFNLTPDRDGTSTYKHCLTLGTKTISGVLYKGIHTDALDYYTGAVTQCFIYPTNAGLSTFKGYLCIAHCDKNGNIKRTLYTKNLIDSSLSSSGYDPTIIIRDEIENGDRLRVMYKGENETSWTQARRETEDIVEEIIICLSPEEAAKNIEFDYDKVTKSLTFGSSYAMQCSISNLAGVVVASSEAIAGSTSTINLATLSSGEYNISFAASGKPYTVKLKL